MTSTVNLVPNIAVEKEETERDEVESVSKNISQVRLTLEEIIANDNEASRQQYLASPTSQEDCGDDRSSVSSTFESDKGSIISISSGVRSINATTASFNDAFRGVEDDEFSNLDRYGFRKSSKSPSLTSITEKEFMEKERLRL